MDGLTIFTIAHNLNRIRYPWRAAILSAAHFAQEVLVCECESDDGTKEDLEALRLSLPNLRVIEHPWGDSCAILKECAELCTAEARCEWTFYLNADEVLREDSDFCLPQLAFDGYRFGQAHYTHFLGNVWTTFPFLYERVTRLQRGKEVGWSEDACSLEISPDYAPCLPVYVQHFGKVSTGRRREAGQKELEFQALYHRHFAVDPEVQEMVAATGGIDYLGFQQARWAKHGLPQEARPFQGRHAIWALEWIREADYVSQLHPDQ